MFPPAWQLCKLSMATLKFLVFHLGVVGTKVVVCTSLKGSLKRNVGNLGPQMAEFEIYTSKFPMTPKMAGTRN